MRKYAGAGFIVLGILLSALGLGAGPSINTRMDRLFSGEAIDWPLLIGGILAVTIGMSLTFHRRNPA